MTPGQEQYILYVIDFLKAQLSFEKLKPELALWGQWTVEICISQPWVKYGEEPIRVSYEINLGDPPAPVQPESPPTT